MKIIRTIIVASVLVFAGLLWVTKEAPMTSQSAFALSPNNHWYILMHLSIMLTFAIDALKNKRLISWLVVGGSVATLAFNMYDFRWIHNISTAVTMAAAVFNIIYYSPTNNRPYAIMTAFVGSVMFLVGLHSNVHLFFAEVVAEFTIGVAMTRRIWRNQ